MQASLGWFTVLPPASCRASADVQRLFSSSRGLRVVTNKNWQRQRRSKRIPFRKLESMAFWGAWGSSDRRGGRNGRHNDHSDLDPKSTERRRALLEYVQQVDPKVITEFSEHAPATVLDAMRTTVSNMLGTIPPQYFEVKVSSTGENLAQLMFSVLLTGYMFEIGMFRLNLCYSISGDAVGSTAGVQRAAAPIAAEAEVSPFAPGVQKRQIQGDVLRWHIASDRAESMPALEYIHMLERENEVLKKQSGAAEVPARGGNALLAYLGGLEAEHVEVLTRSASDDVIEAMNSFVQRMIGTSDLREMRNQRSESNAVELAQLLYWLLVVGYSLRQMEGRFTAHPWNGSGDS